MKLVNVQVIKDELERLIRDYRFHSSTEAKYRCEAYKELSEWLGGLEVEDDMDTIHPIEDVVSNDPIANSYKEKYEQALEVAKETYNKQPMYREWLEKMFPELMVQMYGLILQKRLDGFSRMERDYIEDIGRRAYVRTIEVLKRKEGER